MYWMEGRDEDWRNGDALTHGVTFTNLPSGKYTLHVKAISADGAVSKQERVLEIVIASPWWLSWWMFLIYIVVIIFAIFIYRTIVKQVRYLWN